MRKTILFTFILIGYFVKCSYKKPKVKKDTQENLSIEVRIERGAFHYDTFILKDTLVSFFPKKIDSNYVGNDTTKKYYKKSLQVISKEQLNKFVKKLENNNIWQLKNTYKCHSSCTSALKVTLKINNQKKVIQCEDFKRNCPEIIQYIEHEIIKLHGKNLERIMLPG